MDEPRSLSRIGFSLDDPSVSKSDGYGFLSRFFTHTISSHIISSHIIRFLYVLFLSYTSKHLEPIQGRKKRDQH